MVITDYWKIQNDDFNKIEITCYICGIDLMKEYKKETSQQNDLEEAIQKFPAMVTLYGIRKELCGSCYKSHKSGMDVYQEAHPEWKYPKERG